MPNLKRINQLLTILIIFSIIVCFVLLISFIQKNQALTDSAASGFGETATQDFNTGTLEAFLNTDCTKIFPNSFFTNPNYTEIQKSLKSDYTFGKKSTINIPVDCTYYFNEGKSIKFSIYTYTSNSLIANTRENHFKNVNYVSLNNIYDGARIGIIDTFYGESKFEINVCSTNLFHPVNDFEYASLQYYGFECSEITELNREVSSIVASYLFFTLENVYLAEGFTTQDLLTAFNSTEYINDLKYYAN